MDTQLELLTEKWDGILQTIRQENDLSNVAFKTWLLPLKVFRIEDHVLKITAPFEQAATYVENKYKTFLYVAVAEAMGEEYEIKIITPVDMFPFTSSIESVTVLQKNNR